MENDTYPTIITFEGLSRSGKTTQVEILKHYFQQKGKNVGIAERINNQLFREIYTLRQNIYFQNKQSNSLLLKKLARKYLNYHLITYKNYIKNNYEILLRDRFIFSSFSYLKSFGYDPTNIYKSYLEKLNGGITFYIDINPSTSVMRSLLTKKNLLWLHNLKFTAQLRKEFINFSNKYSFIMIDGNCGIKEVTKQVLAFL